MCSRVCLDYCIKCSHNAPPNEALYRTPRIINTSEGDKWPVMLMLVYKMKFQILASSLLPRGSRSPGQVATGDN